ncbi:aromatic hydrocarbon degradation protein [Thiohalorhabdus denitrificans]|uniref:Long-chain fatty acid transport protein n=1 Tax=Thiohalorhabdus denitrificans TaxID=381306 RepID=A0A0P9EFH4_9GAMM|nr:outer membrane protein transport protein [Thiohalorhabdus denitrificans]KPV41138.1 aromatic hydrocarbon degradation protein [Thiohalorhabdus denitrificans]SCY37046.1 long-chain fatty acid transport protein [Thiohalorhabdus denitrificans]
MRTNRILSAALVACGAIGLSTTAHATNGYQLIGVGSYQKSVGGAVTAAPKSAMTAITNPAGMAAIGNRADFSMEAFMPERSTDFSATGGDKVDSDAELYGVPSIGWTAPVADGSDWYFGGGMYGTSGLGVDYPQSLMMPGAASPTGSDMYWSGYSNIQFWQMSPTLAYRVDDRLKVGAALNIDYQSVAFKQHVASDPNGDGNAEQTVQNFDLSRGASAFGFGLSLGALYDVTDQVTVGLSYKSEQAFSDLEYNLDYGDIGELVPGSGFQGQPAGTYKLGLDYPQQAALGIKFSPLTTLDISADIKWINWSATMDDLKVEAPSGGQDVDMDPGWDDQVVYALGVSWDATPDLSLRAGFNYAESPIDNEDASANLILPGVVESHYTVGANYKFNGHWELGGHFMYAPEVTHTAPSNDPQAPGAEIALEETSAGINIGYRF